MRHILSLALAASALASCTQDEPAEQGTAMPAGEYPLQISGVTLNVESSSEPWSAKAPQTRVAESSDRNSSVWQDKDAIKVGIVGYTDEESRIYRINVSGENVTVAPAGGDPVYWKSKDAAKVRARYPADGHVDLNNQTTGNGLAYALYAETENEVDYNTPSIMLPFTHKLAKVRVVLQGDQAEAVKDVKIKTYTSCTLLADGTLTAEGCTEDYIPMVQTIGKYWEANVVPGVEIKDFRLNKNVDCQLTQTVTPQAGHVHEVNITVKEKLQHIDLSTITESTLTVSGQAVITGKKDNLQVILQAGADVTLQNAGLSYTGLSPILCQGDASLTLAGSNTLAATSVAWDFKTGTGIYVESGTLTINAESGASLAINRNGGGVSQVYGAGIGVAENAGLIINGGTINVDKIADPAYECGAGIGGLCGETSGNITIAGGAITIGQPSWWSAGIGGGSNGNCKNITITGSSTVITVAKGIHNDYHIGCSTVSSVKGTITIGGGAMVNGTKYTETHTGPL